jgi:threonine/homoserine/homoserine lactone efflux protein
MSAIVLLWFMLTEFFLALSPGPAVLKESRLSRWLDRLAGAFLISIGVRLALERRT